ncbi:hypothetical protein HJG44_08665 [Enterovirga sp. DB1703]|uniref:DNA-directed DNA polymerase family A palm domain-containing protein n=1 Tax=Enterovirga aerilata TaxID=2730920 RepID=A0A849I555_9HYPH|nr:hypothetical protein [Enterovirga sp. DB1703]
MSQIELRIAAWMAMDPTMLGIYRNDGDIHTATAAVSMGVSDGQFAQADASTRKLNRFKAKAGIATPVIQVLVPRSRAGSDPRCKCPPGTAACPRRLRASGNVRPARRLSGRISAVSWSSPDRS